MQKVSCAERIRVALAVRDMKQADLCRLTGIKKSAMSQYCNGTITPRQEATDDIAHALNVSVPWLMGFDVPMELNTAPSDELPLDESELLGLYRSVTEPGKAVILGNARMIAGMDEYKR